MLYLRDMVAKVLTLRHVPTTSSCGLAVDKSAIGGGLAGGIYPL